jgi:eukaryotic-like serine/threonine-protein kinase
LLDAHLMRETEAAGQELVECYHDRIREAVAAALSSETAQVHYRSLAAGLASDREADAELISRCWEGAAEPAEAARHAVIAAGQASLTMAFDHAAALYRKALELGAPSGQEAALLMTRLGRALENGGRGAEAAVMYRRAAELCAGDASLELQRRAAEQWLATGHVDEGAALLRTVCSTLGVYFPLSPGSALLSLAWTGLRVRARDLNASVPVDRTLSPRDALRLQTAHTLVTGLIGYQPVHVASVVGRYLLMALDRGDLTERVRSLGFSAYVQSHIDPSSPRTTAFLRRMDELADTSGRAELVGFSSLMKGTSAYHFDRCREARHHFAGALPLLRGCTGVTWDIDAVNVYDQLSASYCGDHADIARCTPALVDEALRRGRVWTGAMLSGFAGMPAWIDADGPQGYRRQLELLGRHWKERSHPLWPDFVLLMGEALLHIREGAPERGFALLEQRYRAYARHMLTRGASRGRLSYAVHQSRCAAAALGAVPAGQRSERARWNAELRRSLASVSQYSTLKARANASLLAALLAFERGARDTSVELLRESVGGFKRAGMHMFVAACQRRLGKMVGGDEGRVLVGLGDELMRAQHVGDLEAETEVCCPGFARGS